MAVAGAALMGLGSFGEGLFNYFSQQNAYRQQSDMSNQNFLQNSALQAQYQNWFSDYQKNITDQKFNNSLIYQDKIAQLKGLNTPSNMLNAGMNKSISSSTNTSTPISVMRQSHWVNENGQTDSSAQANINTEPKDAGVGPDDPDESELLPTSEYQDASEEGINPAHPRVGDFYPEAKNLSLLSQNID